MPAMRKWNKIIVHAWADAMVGMPHPLSMMHDDAIINEGTPPS
jgi:hypothetical protein